MKPIEQQTILVTGATDGLGKQTALALARMDATVLIHGRNPQRIETTLKEIQDATGNPHLETFKADLSSLAEVRALAAEVQSRHDWLDMLINNAAVGSGMLIGPKRELSQDGYELRFAVNYLAPFLLTHLLLPTLRASQPSRIINVGSIGQSALHFDDIQFEHRYGGFEAYKRSKLALVMFTIDLADALKGEQITVNCVHPASLMNTTMVREAVPFPLTTVEEGLRSVMHLATSPDLDNVSGEYFDQLRVGRAHSQAYDPAARQKLQILSRELVGLSDQQTA